MDCEELMVKQVDMLIARSPDTRAFVYRNGIMALPWFSTVRKKITDPQYAPWFLNFSQVLTPISIPLTRMSPVITSLTLMAIPRT